jgi:hypothetical protein
VISKTTSRDPQVGHRRRPLFHFRPILGASRGGSFFQFKGALTSGVVTRRGPNNKRARGRQQPVTWSFTLTISELWVACPHPRHGAPTETAGCSGLRGCRKNRIMLFWPAGGAIWPDPKH